MQPVRRERREAQSVRPGFTGARADLWAMSTAPSTRARTAVTDGATGRSLTYAAFAAQTGRLSLALLRAIPGKEAPCFAVCLPRGLPMVVGMWSAVLAGGIYVPVNPTLPADAMAFILTNTKARVILTTPDLAAAWAPTAIPAGVLIVTLDVVTGFPCQPNHAGIDWESVASLSGAAVQLALDAVVPPTRSSDSAYYIHTSGSTGRPKCVHHNHAALDWHSHETLVGSGLWKDDVHTL